MIIGHLEISSWRGISIGAVHWYCHIHIQEDSEHHQRIELQRPMTAAEARAANKQDKERGRLLSVYKAGTLTDGFNTEEDAIKFGTKYFVDKYPNGILYDRGYASCSAWKKVIYYPLNNHKLEKIVKRMNALADRFQSLNGYECEKKNRERVERLDNRWYKMYSALEYDEI